MRNSLKSTGFAALAFSASAGVLAFTLAPAAASANTVTGMQVTEKANSKVATKKVPIGDLDLTRDYDVRRLESRIREASAAVCSTVPSDVGNMRSEANCREQAKLAADAQVAALRKAAIERDTAGLSGRISASVLVTAK